MATNVLEIGYGSSASSAVISGGEVFADPETHYFGVDLPTDQHWIFPEHFEEIRPVHAHWAALPYRDNAFNAVIMRSCFGQFMDTPRVWLSNRHSLDFALSEAIRVLEPEGILFISEENTPEDLDSIIPDVVRAGFDIEKLEKENDPITKEPSPAYLDLRSRYYGDEIRGFAGGWLCNGRYVLEATKPADKAFSTYWSNAMSILSHRDSIKGEWRSIEDDGKELGFYFPADLETPEAELRLAKTMVELLGDRYANLVEQLEAELK